MDNLQLIFLILLNTPHKDTEAGSIWISNNFQMSPKKEEPRLKRTTNQSLAVDILLRDKISELSNVEGSYLSQVMEHMDAPSLLQLLGKLKEEYATKAKKEDVEEVRNSFDKLTDTLVTMSNTTRRSKSGPAEILSQLSEEQLNDEGAMYNEDEDFYNENEYSEEESHNPSLLAFQWWNSKFTDTDADVWEW